MDEIIFVDKPRGITSFDVVRILRRKLGIKRIGHAGTLDPFATGLLIVGIGTGTKKLKEFEALPKTYLMDILLGKRTDTGDPEGKVIEEKKIDSALLALSEVEGLTASGLTLLTASGEIDSELVKKILSGMEGELELPIPQYSAVKHKGKPLYKYARQGIKIEQKLRTTKIFSLKLLEVDKKDAGIIYGEHRRTILRVEMECEKGTYARAVGEEIGRRLGVPAMLAELRRTKIGDIDVSQAKNPEEI